MIDINNKDRMKFVDGTQINNEILVHMPRLDKFTFHIITSGGARGWQEGAEPPPERFEPPLESFETRIEIRKSYVMSAFLGAQPPPEYFLGAEPPLELFSGSATDHN
jgi:hypothetical protein